MINNPSRCRRNRQKGSGLVEASLTLVTFVILFMGVFDFGQFLFIHQALTERVRAAVRTGALGTHDATAVTNMVVYGTATTPQSPPPRGFFGLSPSNVAVSFDGANTNAYRLVVTVSNLQATLYSPFVVKNLNSIPVRITIPLETP